MSLIPDRSKLSFTLDVLIYLHIYFGHYFTKPNDLRSRVPHHCSWCEDQKCNLEEFRGRNRNLAHSKQIMQPAEPSYMNFFGTSDTCRRYVNDWARLNICWMHIQASVRWQRSSVFFIYFYTYLHLPHRCQKALQRLIMGLYSNLSDICLNAFVDYSIVTVFTQKGLFRALTQSYSLEFIHTILFCFDFSASSLSAHGSIHSKESKEIPDNKSSCFMRINRRLRASV